MNTSSPKRPVGRVLLGLLFSTGYLMLIGALPVGIVTLLQERYDRRLGIGEWAIHDMALMTLIVGGIGGLFLLVGQIIYKVQSRRSQEISK
jgi:hypothetical protein